MARTVDVAFGEFLTNTVRLDPDRTVIAKGSKNWLVSEISKFPDDGIFPSFHPDLSVDFGSFSRKTKIRELDDIDIMFVLNAQGAFYWDGFAEITVTNQANSSQLSNFCNPNTNQINSIKVINKFKEYLGLIPQYKKADIKRSQEAVVLELQSYEWVFDIVPCFRTVIEQSGKDFYLIPDGSGNWKKTDPRIDHQRVMEIKSGASVSVLDVIRLAKYWNRRPTMPSAPSYAFENLVLNFFQNGSQTKYVDVEFVRLLAYIYSSILSPIYDPKGIQGDLNTLTLDERKKISDRALMDYNKAVEARRFEAELKMKESIEKWGEVFGSDFPKYSV